MERSESQILYNFLKTDTFDHAETSIIGQVTRIRRGHGSDQYPKGYIIDRIRPRLDDWYRAPNFSIRSTDIVEPRSVEFRVFPLTFECSKCEYLTQFSKSELKQFNRSGNRQLTCSNPSCSHNLNARDQLQFVKVCKCGDIESLWVPENGKYWFVRESAGLSSSAFVSDDDRQELGYLGGECRECDASAQEREVKVHSASSCFYPQRATFVNIDWEDLDRIRDNERYQRRIVVDYLSDEAPASEKSASEELSSELQAALEKMSDEAREEFSEARENVHEEKKQSRESIKNFIKSEFTEDQVTTISQELFELDVLDGESDSADVYSNTIEDLLEEEHEQESVYNKDDIESAIQTRDEFGINQIRLMENFPITTAVYGYSRLNYDPIDETRLRPFRGKHGKEIYALTNKAEAVQISLDLGAVYKWLCAQPFFDGSPDVNPNDEYSLRKWFLTQLSTVDEPPIPPFESVDPQQHVRCAVTTLLHTYSHVLINTIDSLSGYSRESLVEYLFPRSLSFVVYKRSDSDFSLGAIFTLLEERFEEVAAHIKAEEQDCIYDPVCKHEDDHACEGCLYVSNLSCQFGNHTLSRAPLFGGTYKGLDFTEGYLTVARRIQSGRDNV